MNNPQNIEDILKLLKSSYNDEEKAEEKAPSVRRSSGKMTNEELQNKLRAQFLSDGEVQGESDLESEDSYTLDEDFLSDAAVDSEEKETETPEAEPVTEAAEDIDEDDGIPPFDIVDEDEPTEEEITEEEITEEEIIEEEVAEEEITEEEIPEDEPTEEEITEEEITEEEIIEEEVAEEEITEEEIIEEEIAEDEVVEDEPTEEEIVEEEIVEEEITEEEIPEEEIPEEEITEEEIAEEEITEEEPAEGDTIDITDEEEALFDVLGEDSDIDDGIFIENEEGELVFAKLSENDKAKVEIRGEQTEKRTPPLELYSRDSGQLALFEKEETEEPEPAETEAEVSSESDDSQIIMDFGDSDEKIHTPELSDNINEIDDSVLNLMYEFGDKSFAERIAADPETEERLIGAVKERENREEKIESEEAFAFNGREYEEEEQKDDVFDAYMREKKFLLLRLLGCGAFAAALVIYELLARLGVELRGIFSYLDYPTAFILIGVQLLIFSVAFAWRELFSGMKKAFTFRATRWSSLALVVFFSVVHSVVLSIAAPESLNYLFGGIAAIYVFIGLLCEYLELSREIKTFSVYSAEGSKFTFYTDAAPGSSADMMYRGGVPNTKKIYSPMEISFPNGYFSAVNRAENKDILVNYSITTVVVLSTIAFVIAALLGNSADVALAVFMLTMAVISPISSFALHTMPICMTSSRLYQRDCAVAGEVMAKKYAECDYIVFSDRHLFAAAEARDNGIVVYDERNTKRVIEYLSALYGEIGGPMRGVFGECREKHVVKLRRIARNGVEAVIDNAHSLILGDAEFAKRYGISFPGGAEGDGIIGFAIDGRHSAKLCLKYKTEPLFEMLAGKLAENGISCVIETYDPVINSSFVAACRKNNDDPINVVHKNVMDFYRKTQYRSLEKTGIVVSASRFKLVEAVIWCKRLCPIFKRGSVIQLVLYCVSFAAIMALTVLGLIPMLNQYAALVFQLLCFLPIPLLMRGLPKKDYFSFDEGEDNKNNNETETRE
ncbi:MAG: hypothetical protein E7641_00850 [Ruminococcaceae bacterium]|nr:hypothetical protein [Oscillospiraceae bacterium]